MVIIGRDIPLSKFPFFHKDFINYLNEFGIDNIQCQRVDLIEENNEIIDYDHYMLNILGPLQRIKEYNIKNPPIAGPELFKIDTSKTNNLHIFRIAENPKLIIISDKLNSFLIEKELACVKTVPTQEYLKSDNLSLEELSKTKELISFVEKLKYGKEPFNQKIVENILSEGADVNYYNPKDWTSKPAIVLAQNISNDTNRRNMMTLLFNWGVDVNRKFQYGYLIEEAALGGDIEDLNFLITNGAVDGYEDALCNAIEKDHINIVKLLVEKGTNINTPPALKSCSEAYRCKYKKESNNPIPGLSTAEYLISKGADVNNSEPFYSGIQNNFKELVELFFKKGSTLLKTEKEVFSQAQSAEMIHLFAKLGFDPLELNRSEQSTYLMDSIFWGNKQLFEAFLKYKIDLYAIDTEGKTAFHYGLRSEQKKIIEYLLTIYDLEKVHKIKSVLGIAENPEIQELLKEKLGTEYTSKQNGINTYFTNFDNPTFKQLKELQATTKSKISVENPELLIHLSEINNISSKQLSDTLYTEMEKNIANWALSFMFNNLTAPQVIVLEYQGNITDPFDGEATFYGYEKYSKSNDGDKTYNLTQPVNTLEEKTLSLNYYFDSIDNLTNKFPNQSKEIQNYYRNHAFMQLHAIFNKLEEAKKFSILKNTTSLLIFGRVHDEDPILIYKID